MAEILTHRESYVAEILTHQEELLSNIIDIFTSIDAELNTGFFEYTHDILLDAVS